MSASMAARGAAQYWQADLSTSACRQLDRKGDGLQGRARYPNSESSGLPLLSQSRQKASLRGTSSAAHQHGEFATCHRKFQILQSGRVHRSVLRTAPGNKPEPYGSPRTTCDSAPLSFSHALGGSLETLLLTPGYHPPDTCRNLRPIIAGRRDRRRSRREDTSNLFLLPAAFFALTVPAVLVGAGFFATNVVGLALGMTGFVVLSAMTATLAVIGPLLLFLVPIFGIPVGLFFGLTGFGLAGAGGVVRTVLDFGLTLAITSNFVSALLGRAKRKKASEADDEEEVVPIGEQIRRMAMAEVEKGLKDFRQTLPSQVGKQQAKEQKKDKKESKEEVALRKASEAQEALREVASVAWWAPTVASLVPGLNGLAWLAAADAFPGAVEGPRRKAFIRNALVYGAPALLYLLASPFQGVSLMGFMRGEAWWLSLVFGLVHLQLERKDMVDEARARVAETRLPEPKPEDELERASRELQEFDQQLSTVAWSRESPSKWTEANVSEWLRDEGLGRLVGTFAEHHIDGGVLLTLDGEELRKELDITSLGDRKKVLAAIARLKAKEMEWGARVVQDLDR